MDPKDFNNLKKAIEKVANTVKTSEKFLLLPLVSRMAKAAQENPGDQTIIGMATFLHNRSASQTLITRAELNDVYNKLYVSNTRCSEYLEKELNKTASTSPVKKLVRQDNEGTLVKDAFKNGANELLVNALEAAFDKNATYKPYTAEMAKRAEQVCTKELREHKYQPTKIQVVAGNEDCLLCQATYETPKGRSSVIIPVEIVGEKALFPSVFVSAAGFEALEQKKLSDYLVSTAGKQLQVNVPAVLNAVKVAKHGVQEGLNEVEQIVLRANAKKETPAYDSNAIIGQSLASPDVIETKADLEETETFAAKLSSAKGLAELTFGKKAVESGRQMLIKELNSFGYKSAQVSVASVNDSTVVYVVASNGRGIKVPVKFNKGLPKQPLFAIANGIVGSFDQQGVNDLLSVNDSNTAALASQLNGNKPSELIDVVQKAVVAGNYEIAEDALNVLAHSDEKAFKYAFNLYKEAIGNQDLTKQASKSNGCNLPIKSATSTQTLCGHTNLPLNKVYQDEHGDCYPLYRKHIDHSNEGGSFLHSRIYLG